jgi:ketosteroid isomerase-like protein
MKKGKTFLGNGMIITAIVLMFTTCSTNKENLISELIQTDLAFSELSGDKGVKRALVDFIDTANLFLANNQMLIDVKNVVIEHFRNSSDSGIVLSWKPLGADITASGNVGYTYGTFKVESIDSVAKGTYVSMWKKDKNGEWKFVLDSDNKEIALCD